MRPLLLVVAISALTIGPLSLAVGCGRDKVIGERLVDSSSMQPTISDGEIVRIVDYGSRAPRRGDIVLCRFPANPERESIDRIIGEPGDMVEVRDGEVLIDGKVLEEPYVQVSAEYSYGPRLVPPDYYFVLSDNRNNSYDSSDWGFLPKKNVIGRVKP
jgi:signal peptidase I